MKKYDREKKKSNDQKMQCKCKCKCPLLPDGHIPNDSPHFPKRIPYWRFDDLMILVWLPNNSIPNKNKMTSMSNPVQVIFIFILYSLFSDRGIPSSFLRTLFTYDRHDWRLNSQDSRSPWLNQKKINKVLDFAWEQTSPNVQNTQHPQGLPFPA